jgi:hypothetical protein
MSILGRWPLLLAIVASCGLLPACTLACTAADAYEGLILEVEVTGGRLPAGNYTIVARVDGVEIRLDETLNEDGGSASIAGIPEAVVDDHRVFVDGVVFAQSGLIAVGFRDGGGPAEVTVEVWRGATMLVQQTYTPRYMEYRPNGPSCSPVVDQARDRLVLKIVTLVGSQVAYAARRDARWGEWAGFAGPEGTGTSPLDRDGTGTVDQRSTCSCVVASAT